MNGGYTGNRGGHGTGMRGAPPALAGDGMARLQADFSGASPEQQAGMWGNRQLQPYLQRMIGGDKGAVNTLESASWTAPAFGDAAQYGVPAAGGAAQAKPMMGGAAGGMSQNPQMIASLLRQMNGGGSGTSGQGGFDFGRQTDMGGVSGAGNSVMGQMGGAGQSAGGGMGPRNMFAGGSRSFNENAGMLGAGAGSGANLNRLMYPPAAGSGMNPSQGASGQFMSPWGQMQDAGQGTGWSGFAAPQPGASGQVWY